MDGAPETAALEQVVLPLSPHPGPSLSPCHLLGRLARVLGWESLGVLGWSSPNAAGRSGEGSGPGEGCGTPATATSLRASHPPDRAEDGWTFSSVLGSKTGFKKKRYWRKIPISLEFPSSRVVFPGCDVILGVQPGTALLAGTCPPFGTWTPAPAINDQGHRVTATRAARDLQMDGPGPPSEAGGCPKSPCKAPVPLKISAAHGGPLGVGDSEGQDRAGISHPEVWGCHPAPLRPSCREVEQTGRCGAWLDAVTAEDAPADARPRGHRDVGRRAAGLGPPRRASRGKGPVGAWGFVLDPGDFKERAGVHICV